MRIILGVCSRKGAIEPQLLARINDMAELSLTFRGQPYRSAAWGSPSGRLLLCVWDNATDDETPLIDVSDDGRVAQAWSGHAHDRTTSNAALVRADDGAGALRATTTLTRLAPVYWAQAPDVGFVATRALLLARLLQRDGRPRYDLQGVVPILTDGFLRNDRTPFQGVELLPAAGTVRLTRDACHVQVPDVAELACGSLTPGPGDYDDLAAHLLAAVATTAGQEVHCNLSGGRDSRLVAAALKSAGARFDSSTLGPVGHPDVVVAARVAEALGIPHRRRDRPIAGNGAQAIEVDLAARARDVLFATDGMLTAHDDAGRRGPYRPKPIGFGGQGGASLRGGYAKRVAKDLDATWEAASRFLLARQQRFGRLFRAGAMDDYAGCIQRWISSESGLGIPAGISLDRYYVVYRTGRWAGPLQAPQVSGSDRAPLFDDWITRFALRLAPAIKAQDGLARTMTLRFAPELRDVPYAPTRWEQVAPVQEDADGDAGTSGWDWRQTCTTDMYPAFMERIFGGQRNDPLFAIVDRDRVMRWCQRHHGDATVSVTSSRFWWGLYTLSVLLSNEWLEPDQGPSQVVTVPTPRGVALSAADR